MSMTTNYRFEIERPGAKSLRKALKRQESRIKVKSVVTFIVFPQSQYQSFVWIIKVSSIVSRSKQRLRYCSVLKERIEIFILGYTQCGC